MIISGQNIAESFNSIFPDFLTNYIGITLISNSTTDRKLIGAGNIFALDDSVVIGGSGAYANQNSKDVIDIITGSGALPILYYRALTGSDADSVAGVYMVCPSGNRVIFLGFGAEGVGSLGTYLTKKNFLATLFGLRSDVSENSKISVSNTIILKSGQEIKLDENINKVFLVGVDGRLISEIKTLRGKVVISDLKGGIYYLIYEDTKGLQKKKVLVVD